MHLTGLPAAIHPLALQVSTGNLERVRKVKTRHQRLTIRCETLRDELERFLHDDDDMVGEGRAKGGQGDGSDSLTLAFSCVLCGNEREGSAPRPVAGQDVPDAAKGARGAVQGGEGAGGEQAGLGCR